MHNTFLHLRSKGPVMAHLLHRCQSLVPNKPLSDQALLGWGLLTAWGLTALVLDLAPIPGPVPVLNIVTSLASIGACLALLLISRLPSLAGIPSPASVHPALIWSPAVFMAVCSIANQAMLWVDAPSIAAILVQMASSAAYIWLMYLWFIAYRLHDPQVVEDHAVWSTGLCAAIYLVSAVAPYPIALVLWVSLPLLSAACLASFIPLPPEVQDGDTPPSSKSPAPAMTPTRIVRPAIRPALGVALSAIACAFAFALAINAADFTAAATYTGFIQASAFGGLALAAVLVLRYITSTRRIELRSLFRLLYPVAASGLFLAALPHPGPAALGLGLCSAGQWALYVFIWIRAVERSDAASGASASHFALARIAFDTGGVLGGLVAMAAAALGSAFGISAPVYILFGGLAVFTASNALLPYTDGNRGACQAPDVAWSDKRPTGKTSEMQLINDLIAQRSNRLAKRFGLSERETQILVRLLKGYSTASIRNELAIAKGTVDTYIQRIYRKCGVHSRQQLVELGEERTNTPNENG